MPRGLLILPITAPMIFDLAGCGSADRAVRRPAPDDRRAWCAEPRGLVLLTRVDATLGLRNACCPGYLLFGIALGLVYAPMSSAAMAAMPQEKAGIASGVLAMNRVLAGALSVAIGGAIFQSVEAGTAGKRGGRLHRRPLGGDVVRSPGWSRWGRS